ncbi:MAG: hypothetical protein KAG97_05990, partial [Victivallales bacterium]|nr:hypothetical protein [Victivallales bacterium]
IIPEDEIEEAYKNLNGKVEAKRIKFQAAKFADKIKYAEKEIRDYFEAHKVEYRTAPASKGAVVLFDYADFNVDAEKSVTLADIEKYYNDHKFLYVKKNLKKTALKKDAKTEYEPLAKVSAKIRTIQVEAKAKDLAFAAAQTFSDKLYNRTVDVFYDEQDKIAARAKCAKIFADSAAEAKRKSQPTGWLVEGVATGAGLQTEKALVAALNKLQIDNPLSEPVKGSKSVYVALLEEKRSPKLETFEQAETRVKAAYVKEKSLNLARETARNTALKISEELAKNAKLADVEKKLNLKFEDFQVTPYSRVSPAESDAAFSTPVGKLAKMVETPDGAVLLYVAAKPVPTMKEYEKQKKFFAMRYKMMKRNAIFRNYVESLVSASAPPKEEK